MTLSDTCMLIEGGRGYLTEIVQNFRVCSIHLQFLIHSNMFMPGSCIVNVVRSKLKVIKIKEILLCSQTVLWCLVVRMQRDREREDAGGGLVAVDIWPGRGEAVPAWVWPPPGLAPAAGAASCPARSRAPGPWWGSASPWCSASTSAAATSGTGSEQVPSTTHTSCIALLLRIQSIDIIVASLKKKLILSVWWRLVFVKSCQKIMMWRPFPWKNDCNVW